MSQGRRFDQRTLQSVQINVFSLNGKCAAVSAKRQRSSFDQGHSLRGADRSQ